MLNLYCFTDKNLEVVFKFNLDSHHFIHAKSKLTITSNCPEFGIEVHYIIKIIKKISVIYARLKDQYNIKYHTIISARFDKQDEDNQVLDETELYINLKINHN